MLCLQSGLWAGQQCLREQPQDQRGSSECVPQGTLTTQCCGFVLSPGYCDLIGRRSRIQTSVQFWKEYDHNHTKRGVRVAGMLPSAVLTHSAKSDYFSERQVPREKSGTERCSLRLLGALKFCRATCQETKKPPRRSTPAPK